MSNNFYECYNNKSGISVVVQDNNRLYKVELHSLFMGKTPLKSNNTPLEGNTIINNGLGDEYRFVDKIA